MAQLHLWLPYTVEKGVKLIKTAVGQSPLVATGWPRCAVLIPPFNPLSLSLSLSLCLSNARCYSAPDGTAFIELLNHSGTRIHHIHRYRVIHGIYSTILQGHAANRVERERWE